MAHQWAEEEHAGLVNSGDREGLWNLGEKFAANTVLFVVECCDNTSPPGGLSILSSDPDRKTDFISSIRHLVHGDYFAIIIWLLSLNVYVNYEHIPTVSCHLIGYPCWIDDE
ncbi:hypothetical protein PAAG_11851 [Paracoccidioides lutzii Pb01]|uniref:Uncharacterized protein n=1 Tax=Paracoccidioides lutzii (strain ATCC MYA-826 / Pb01) TaxID=502779 RepID=A0A0A2V1K4_PARBA|nr:hypothetical protein PAAG_11851 [Paracoccidioides lutzii Pb01]KGQ01388.1 hypothetical protein PAAG_11851 [Paracoccidioides lutzii Pb01]